MKKNCFKMTALAALAGTVFQFGGCSLNGLFNAVLQSAPIYLGLEYLTDGGVLDLIPFTTGDDAAQ